MSATLFLAFCILGCDFLLYFLFQWTYGEKRRGLSRRQSALRTATNQPDTRPFLVASRRNSTSVARHLPTATRRMNGREAGELGQFNEARAYRRIAASFAQGKR
jgi:hypothetical protein